MPLSVFTHDFTRSLISGLPLATTRATSLVAPLTTLRWQKRARLMMKLMAHGSIFWIKLEQTAY
jgi:hypothetical protein